MSFVFALAAAFAEQPNNLIRLDSKVLIEVGRFTDNSSTTSLSAIECGTNRLLWKRKVSLLGGPTSAKLISDQRKGIVWFAAINSGNKYSIDMYRCTQTECRYVWAEASSIFPIFLPQKDGLAVKTAYSEFSPSLNRIANETNIVKLP